MKRSKLRITASVFGFGLLAGLLSALISNLWVIESTKSNLYQNISDVPSTETALVLGTTHKLKTGKDNAFFTERIKTAANLYHRRKVKGFILSGDHRSPYYNEPLKMQEALVSYGVPDSVIILDNSGLRTLDSVVRCGQVFGKSDFTIVTQEFHAYRALFISEHYSLNAVALAAGEPPGLSSFRVMLREYVARPLAVIDLFVLDTEPSLVPEVAGP